MMANCGRKVNMNPRNVRFYYASLRIEGVLCFSQ